VFVSYRRDDSKHAAGRLGERLHERFRLFMDIDNIRPGTDFTAVVREAVDEADVVLAVIGNEWLAATGDIGTRRIDDPEDWVALEVGTALRRGTPVIPVLVDGARMPDRSELPASLSDLASRQAISLDHESFGADCTRLIETIDLLVGAEQATEVDLWADSDYPAARSALLQGQWAKAAEGLERVLRRHPRHPQVLDQLDEARRKQNLVDLDRRARDAATDGRWGVAVEALEAMQGLQPSEDVAERLGEARRQQKVRSLQQDVRALAELGDWAAVVAADAELAKLHPSGADPEGLATRARAELAEAKLEADYVRGLQQLDGQQWDDAEATFAAILTFRPGYRDGEALLELARQRGAPEEPEVAEEPEPEPAPEPEPEPEPEPVEQPQPPPVVPPAPPQVALRPAVPADAPGRRVSTRVVVAAVVAALVVVGGVVTGVVLVSGGDSGSSHERSAPPTNEGPTTEAVELVPPPADGTELAAAPGLSVPAATTTIAMAGRTAGVQVAAVGDVAQIGAGDEARSAPEGGRLIGFQLATWACNAGPCRGWSSLDLVIVVDGDRRGLPDTQGSYVVAVPAGASHVDLVTKADGTRQSLSLLTGAPGPDNLAVLARTDRLAKIDTTFPLTETSDPAARYADGVVRSSAVRNVTIKTARLDFFVDSLRPKSGQTAFLVVDVTYLRPYAGETRHPLKAEDIRFRADDGTIYKDIAVDTDVDLTLRAFEIPAATTGGTLLLGSPRRTVTGDNGISYTYSLSPHEVSVRFS